MFSCPSQFRRGLPKVPPENSWTNRTPALQQPPGDQAGAAEVGRLGAIDAVEGQRFGRLALQVGDLGTEACIRAASS